MNTLSSRNYFVVAVAGVFCWLNTSVVSAQTVGWVDLDPSLQQALSAEADRQDALKARVEALEAMVATLQANSVPNLGTYLRIGDHNGQPVALFEAVNVMVVNGTGTTGGATNGVGNLIVGYDPPRETASDKSGSHNLVVGTENNYSSYGGFVAGNHNTVSGEYAVVSGGVFNTASELFSSVSGGNTNRASGDSSSVSGGAGNHASGRFSSVSGGFGNAASDDSSSVSGGEFNTAPGRSSSVSGGFDNEASGDWSSVSGGVDNMASGDWSSVSGGSNGSAPGAEDWRAGGFFSSGN